MRKQAFNCFLNGAVAIQRSRSYSQFASGFSMPVPRKLAEIMSPVELQRLSPEDASNKWNDHHIGRGHISTVLTGMEYNTFQHRVKSCPMFVVPVLKPKGFVTMFLQAQIPHILFTGLDDYRARGPNASPYFAVTHFLDLLSTKDIVLVRGDVVLPSKLSDIEARQLLKNAHSFYVDERKFRHVQAFNKDTHEFDFNELLREVGASGN